MGWSEPRAPSIPPRNGGIILALVGSSRWLYHRTAVWSGKMTSCPPGAYLLRSPWQEMGRKEVSNVAQVIYDVTFYQEGTEARAVIVDYSGPAHVEFRFGITERMDGASEIVTYRSMVKEKCTGVPGVIRRALWWNLYQQARDELGREIKVASDPHYELEEREIY